DIVRALFGIAGVTVLAGATRKEGAARGVGPRKGTKRDAVAVDVEIAAELYASSELLRGLDLAAAVAAAFVPFEGLDQPVVHADVKIEHDEDRGLQPVGEIERFGGKGKALARVLGKQQHVLGVAVSGVAAADSIGLVGARPHVGRAA